MTLNRHQRDWLRDMHARTLANERVGAPEWSTPAAIKAHAAEKLWMGFARMFTTYTLNGNDDTARFTLPIAAIARRYHQVCVAAWMVDAGVVSAVAS